ncbi:tRNA lysidine(34) synthetase TilS [Pigmentibacter sp. JX0631]|uniref:tRNA lysidine(34) synthetase TilS n=1 Tax=Pigmentibacter sp. JX0631 TaxID=2976982 RepID=UPI002468E5F3|nr:tRNA lysidine(34) synthetase TilS [Pigmentibacter sp. JX0631]WGL58538.1 tRNA lysidine(34) synthetase TilS [Pigmentibacter sp. JX0631]
MTFSVKSLNSFEYHLLEKMHIIDKRFGLNEKINILLNVQVSGGMDSMCLLSALNKIIYSKHFKNKNNFIIIVQHFNHQMRGVESDLDSQFVVNFCIKNGIAVYIEKFNNDEKNLVGKNFQQTARNWRKSKAIKLCIELSKQLKCEKYFILTAHHARDHVETILQHVIRGCSLEGLIGINEFDENDVYFRPFSEISFSLLQKYCNEQKIEYRLDSSNESDKYARNYIRHNILPHLSHLNLSYEKAFVSLSQDVACLLTKFKDKKFNYSLDSNWNIESFSVNEIYSYLIEKNKELKRVLTRNAVLNILHEIQIFKKSNFLQKDINLAQGWIVQLNKVNNNIDIEVIQKKFMK